MPPVAPVNFNIPVVSPRRDFAEIVLQAGQLVQHALDREAQTQQFEKQLQFQVQKEKENLALAKENQALALENQQFKRNQEARAQAAEERTTAVFNPEIERQLNTLKLDQASARLDLTRAQAIVEDKKARGELVTPTDQGAVLTNASKFVDLTGKLVATPFTQPTHRAEVLKRRLPELGVSTDESSRLADAYSALSKSEVDRQLAEIKDISGTGVYTAENSRRRRELFLVKNALENEIGEEITKNIPDQQLQGAARTAIDQILAGANPQEAVAQRDDKVRAVVENLKGLTDKQEIVDRINTAAADAFATTEQQQAFYAAVLQALPPEQRAFFLRKNAGTE